MGMPSPAPLTDESPAGFQHPGHKEWLSRHREALLDFFQPKVRLAEGGYAWLDEDGDQLRERGAQLWLGARMIHVFSIASLLGRAGADAVVRHGLDFYVAGPGHDARSGGWFPTVGGDEPDDRKDLYGIAQTLLAGNSATVAGFAGGENLMDESLDVIERHFWLEDWGLCAEGYDRTFSRLDPYRGQNANMHLTEAYLAVHQVTGDSVS